MNVHLQVLDPSNFGLKNSIKLQFPEHCKHDVFRAFYLSGYCGRHLMVYGAVYIDQEQVDNNAGYFITFWIGEDLNANTDYSLMKNCGRIKYYFQFD